MNDCAGITDGYQPTNAVSMDSLILPNGDAGKLVSQPGRYLTGAQKRIELLEFQQRRIPDWDGLVSLPDPDIVQYLAELNSISGLCTLQSCAGHIERDTRDGSEYITNGNLWLWLSKKMMAQFYVAALELRRQPGIEGVAIQFQQYGREFIDIHFAGAGHGKLESSMNGIIGFFMRLSSTGAKA